MEFQCLVVKGTDKEPQFVARVSYATQGELDAFRQGVGACWEAEFNYRVYVRGDLPMLRLQKKDRLVSMIEVYLRSRAFPEGKPGGELGGKSRKSDRNPKKARLTK